jgi:ribonuclease BN (tRNA processing enzyme)
LNGEEEFMHLIILGSGTGIPMAQRGSPSLLFYAEEGPMLMDIGPGSLRQLARVGVPFEKVKRILTTHFHPDHTADLVHFLFATRNPSVLNQRAPFVITGPQGLKDLLGMLQRAFEHWLDIPSEIMTVDELSIEKPDRRSFPSFRLISQPLKHTPRSVAYRIELPSGKSFVYSGDTGYCSEIIELARGTELLALECAFPEGHRAEGHLTPSEAGRIGTLAKVGRLVLLHLYPETLKTDVVGECRKTYGGELILGSDLLHLSIS